MNITRWLEQNIGIRMLMVHDTVYQKTNGRIGHSIPLPGVPPSLLLHTVGAKTGKQRTNTLSYFPDRGDYLVVAGPQRVPVTATPVLPDDPDYARMWDKVNEQNSNRYNGYQKRTTRAIPIVRLTPRSGGS